MKLVLLLFDEIEQLDWIYIIFTSWYDVSHAMGFRGWGRNSIKNHSLTHSLTHFVRQLIYALNLD